MRALGLKKTLQTAPLCCVVLASNRASLRPCPIGVLSPCCRDPTARVPAGICSSACLKALPLREQMDHNGAATSRIGVVVTRATGRKTRPCSNN